MQAISEEQIQVVGLAAGGGQHLPSRLHRGNSEPETGRADLEDADLDEGLGQSECKPGKGQKECRPEVTRRVEVKVAQLLWNNILRHE